jgi:hypothetical protein
MMPEWYANPDPRYQPAMRIITDITRGPTTTITTSPDHDYVTGLIVRLYVPRNYGMIQINNFVGIITVLSSDSFSMVLDTTTYDSFLAPASPPYYRETALVVPVGNVDDVYNVAVRNVST